VSLLRLVFPELKLLTRSRLAWVVMAITVGLSALGVNAVENGNQMAFHGMRRTAYSLSLGAAQYGAMAGAALFGFLALLRISRDDRKQCRTLLEASGDYVTVLAARISALLLGATTSAVLALLIAVGLHLVVSDARLEWPPYVFSFGVILWPTLMLSILTASAVYLLVRNLDIAFFGYLGLYWIGINASGYLWRWIQTPVSVYSDFAGIDPVGRFIVYNRLFCIAAALGLLCLGFVLHRRPGFSGWRSLSFNCRGGVLPVCLILTTLFAVLLHQREPYLFPADPLSGHDLPKDNRIRLGGLECQVELHPKQRSLECKVRYRFEKEEKVREMVLVTNTGLQIKTLKINGQDVAWERIPDTDRVRVPLPPTGSVELMCQYQGGLRSPRAGGFAGYIAPQSVYLLENSYWLFVPLTALGERVSVRGSITAPAELTVVPPGVLEDVLEGDGVKVWQFAAEAPRLHLGVFAAEYDVERFTVGDLDVEFYVSPRHRDYVQGAELPEHLARIVRFYQEFYGPPVFPEWPLRVVENSIYKPGGHSSLNVVTIAEYMLNRQDATSELDRLRLERHDLKLLAHEIAHQWWGTSVDVVPDGPWSSEGLAEYSAYCCARRHLPEKSGSSIRGGWFVAVQAQRGGYWSKNPAAAKRLRPSKRRQLELSALSTDLYSRMPLKLAETEDVLGEEEFGRRLSSLYAEFRGGELSFGEFLVHMDLTEEELIGD
jgi:hypothetical protein